MTYLKNNNAKCDNAKNGCQNFTTNHDLAGSWCCSECFCQHESGERPTRKQFLQSILNWKWDLEDWQIAEIKHLGLEAVQ